MPLQPTTPTETEPGKPVPCCTRPPCGVLFLDLSFQHQITCLLESRGALHVHIRLFNTLNCCLNQHCADQHLFIVLLLHRCSSVAYISCLSANIFNLKLSERTVSWSSVLTIIFSMHEFCSAHADDSCDRA